MDLKSFLTVFEGQGVNHLFFKAVMILLALLYLFYSLVASKQVSILDKTLEDKHNQIINLITSLQTMVALVLLILAVFFT